MVVYEVVLELDDEKIEELEIRNGFVVKRTGEVVGRVYAYC
jgi:sporulation protein YlmC with PRC-barrel domain